MSGWKKWIVRGPKTAKRFKAFSKTAKNAKHLKIIVKNDSALRKILTKVFSTKTVLTAAVATTVGVGISHVNDYIQSNSGCFLKSSDGTICKVAQLSCCQPEPVDGVSPCPQAILGSPCHGFDEDKEKSCCKLCDCKYNDCLPNQTMECQRPTIGEALTYFSQGVASNLFSFLANVFPVVYWICGGMVALLIFWITWTIYKKTRQ